jgi:tRNA-specific 2-thiouridylase
VFYDGEICLGGGVIEVAEPWTSKGTPEGEQQ